MNKVLSDHFKKADPLLYKVMLKLEPLESIKPIPLEKFFESLTDHIISQQLSGKVALVIFERFKTLFLKQHITPQSLLEIPDETLRSVGISYAKITYLKDLAGKVHNGQLNLKMLPQLLDEEVIEQLIKVKGIGRWTAEMFLMFSLGREDVFSHGDLGLKNALKNIYTLNNPTVQEVEEIVSKWSPYKSYASRILWKSLNNR